jgi:subtilase family serine protease
MTLRMHSRTVTAAIGSALLASLFSASASARPLNVLIPRQSARQPTIQACERSYGIRCYNAAEIEQAYGVLPLFARGINGHGATIVIVDSYGSPTIQHDLQVYDTTNHLPAPPSFQVIAPVGPIPPYSPKGDDVGWAEETTLDVELSHTIAPGANILLVETPVDETEGITGLPQMMAAEDYVIAHHLGDVISQSWGATEQTFQNAAGTFAPQQIQALGLTYNYAAANGVTVLAATGDAGATDYQRDETNFYTYPVIDFPDDDPNVTAVGGLNLTLNVFGQRLSPDAVWNDPNSVCAAPCAGNGGLSVVFGRPSYQNSLAGTVGTARGVPDVSLSASVSGSVNTYTSFISVSQGVPLPGWYPEAGTSEASPLMAGEVALADQLAGHSLGPINPALYAMGDGSGSGLTDITLGNTTVTFTQGGGSVTVTGAGAAPGYDLASGLGEPNGSFPAQLAALAGG